MDKNFFIHPPKIIKKNKKFSMLFRDISQAAVKDTPVLISGENGTYKNLIAEAVHSMSARANGPFINSFLSNTQDDVIEKELFGCTDRSRRAKKGKFFEADGGTLFIEDVLSIPCSVQNRIVQFLKNKNNGDDSPREPNTRLILSTNGSMKDIARTKKLSHDLYDICSGTKIRIHALKERTEDILPIAQYFLEEIRTKYDTGVKEFSRDAKDFLVKHIWPDNLREIFDTIKRSALLTEAPVIRKKDLLKNNIASYSMKEFLEEKLKRYLSEMTKLNNCKLHTTVLSEVEKSLITIVLKETNSNQLKAAKTLGINRNTLRTKIREYRIRI